MSAYKINLPEEKDINGALAWAKKNCPSYITNSANLSTTANFTKFGYVYTFYFYSEKDALMFELKWS